MRSYSEVLELSFHLLVVSNIRETCIYSWTVMLRWVVHMMSATPSNSRILRLHIWRLCSFWSQQPTLSDRSSEAYRISKWIDVNLLSNLLKSLFLDVFFYFVYFPFMNLIRPKYLRTLYLTSNNLTILLGCFHGCTEGSHVPALNSSYLISVNRWAASHCLYSEQVRWSACYLYRDYESINLSASLLTPEI